ncbi:MAG TPA: NAD(P)H-dependent dehydrogenase/reductase [Methanomicrobia archaeon]|nr:NAD(P)H-dependent dehydrogenase/reductase [Methanomicrobia archaeon]
MLELVRTRRSVRQYRDKEIEPELIELLKEAALRSPTSRNFKPWRFLFVTDKARLKALSRAKPSGSSFLTGAALGVVICADETESDVWIEDCSIASIILQLTGQSLGLGSCWIQIRNRMHDDSLTAEEYVKDVLELPVNFRVESIIAFGYPAETKPPIPKSELEYHKILDRG